MGYVVLLAVLRLFFARGGGSEDTFHCMYHSPHWHQHRSLQAKANVCMSLSKEENSKLPSHTSEIEWYHSTIVLRIHISAEILNEGVSG